jgi:glyoxylase-like metal-dependent hydrolase (beta-lactamase superfamily II)
MVAIQDVRRVRLGRFVRPAEETGTGQPLVEDALGYLLRHDRGLLLFDTGIGAADAETEAWYRPVRWPLQQALRSVGHDLGDVDVVVNCHLHFDHCGGNPLLAGRPVVCQRTELAAARTEGYTVPELVDHAGVRYELLDGEAELIPGVFVVPTPGHTEGHQSLVVRCADGTVVLAGQAHDHASDFAGDALAVAAGEGTGVPGPRPWLRRLLEMDPARVYFAHDASVWEPL